MKMRNKMMWCLMLIAIIVISVISIMKPNEMRAERIVVETGLYAKEVKQPDGKIKIIWEQRKDLGGRTIAFDANKTTADAFYKKLHGRKGIK